MKTIIAIGDSMTDSRPEGGIRKGDDLGGYPRQLQELMPDIGIVSMTDVGRPEPGKWAIERLEELAIAAIADKPLAIIFQGGGNDVTAYPDDGNVDKAIRRIHDVFKRVAEAAWRAKVYTLFLVMPIRHLAPGRNRTIREAVNLLLQLTVYAFAEDPFLLAETESGASPHLTANGEADVAQQIAANLNADWLNLRR